MNIEKYKRMLLCDDDEDIVEYLAIEAARLGFEVDFASSGKIAWEKLNNQKYDLVVTDYMMPGLNGIELASELSKTQPEIHVMLVTGSSRENIEVEAKNAGILKTIFKPINTLDFRDAVLSLFNEAEKEIENKLSQSN